MNKALLKMTADPDEPNKNIKDDLKVIRDKLSGLTNMKDYSGKRMNKAF